jgi:hypothetical protein
LYGSTLEAAALADQFDLTLLEPPLDLLARLPPALLLRRVESRRWENITAHFPGPLFLKPADPLAKVFDAGVYRERAQVRTPTPIAPDTPVLVAEPVEWLAEYRCFVLEGLVVAGSPYLSFGRPLHHAAAKAAPPVLPAAALDVCRRLLAPCTVELPPAFVVDVGLIEDRGWAVVEFNPAWCSGLLSADPDPVLDVLRRACRTRENVSPHDRRWIVNRPAARPGGPGHP